MKSIWWPWLGGPAGFFIGREFGQVAAYHGTLRVDLASPTRLAELERLGLTPYTDALRQAHELGGMGAAAGTVVGFVLSVAIAKSMKDKPVYVWISPLAGAVAGAIIATVVCYCGGVFGW